MDTGDSERCGAPLQARRFVKAPCDGNVSVVCVSSAYKGLILRLKRHYVKKGECVVMLGAARKGRKRAKKILMRLPAGRLSQRTYLTLAT